MRILISNDDGVYAAGLMTLANTLAEIAEITVVAPDRNRSGASNSLNIDIPIRCQKLPNGFYSVSGTPTDCVHLALTGMLTTTFDMVVSGINETANLGDDIVYSGTVAAATEGRALGLPAIAVSLATKDHPKNYSTAATIVKDLVQRLEANPFPAGTILNVNVPDLVLSEIKGIEVTRLGTRHIAEPAIRQIDPRGSEVFWIGNVGDEADAGPGTDFHAIRSHHVSITPLQIDMTNYKAFEQLSKWLKL
jgi:5'-nucleotidase